MKTTGVRLLYTVSLNKERPEKMKNSRIEYRKLITSAKQYYESRPLELQNIRNGKEIFDLVWCDGLCEEINLWTYWQGAGVDEPEVMIVGQDFGLCVDAGYPDFFNKCIKSSPKDRKTISNEYIHYIIEDNKRNITDRILIKLTKDGLGEQYGADIPGNELLFMTNLCLGYRTGNKISGGDIKACLRHDSIYVRDLITIKKPKVVICLGMDTYISLLTAFSVDREKIRDICSGFWLKLDKADNHEEIVRPDYMFRIYGVSHAGSNGAINRIKNCTLDDKNKKHGEELMIRDWEKIGEYLKSERR